METLLVPSKLRFKCTASWGEVLGFCFVFFKPVYSYLCLSGFSPKGKERNLCRREFRALDTLFLSQRIMAS